MIVKTSTVDVAAGERPMRVLLAEPAQNGGRFPGLLLFTDIFALTPSMERAVVRFASYGFVVAVPEFYHRTESAGTMIPFAERERAMAAAGATLKEHFDADTRTTLDYLQAHPRVRPGALGVTGFCIGGHLAVRAALQPEVAASVAFYPTGLPDQSLGGSGDADTLAQVATGGLKGKMMLGFGATDPHVPLSAITRIQEAFARSGAAYFISMYDGEHAFMRDEGPRYNASETDRAYADAVAFFRETLGGIDA
ncbi:MAG: dienelactone hydrolase family protein [Candidatus Velthaea sp.]